MSVFRERFMGQEEYQELSSFLRRFIRRLKFIEGVEGLCLTAICALLLFALGPGIDQLKNFFPYAPLAYSIFTASSFSASRLVAVSLPAPAFARTRGALHRAKTTQAAQ